MAAPNKTPPAPPTPDTEPSRRIPRWSWLVPVALLGLSVYAFWLPALRAEDLSYSTFKQAVREGRVTHVAIGDEAIGGEVRWSSTLTSTRTAPAAAPRHAEGDKVAFRTLLVPDTTLFPDLEAHGVEVRGVARSDWTAGLWLLALLGIPLLLSSGLSRRLRDAQSGVMSIGKSRARIAVETDVKVTFKDVAGVDEATAELGEIVEYLKTPEKFTRLGGRIPKGVLLVGPPGTGKTLLAKAVAGEAGVPFFFISGSDFVEMFVGVGAARVRDLFAEAKKKAPCIIFIDELDALGKARGSGPMAHEEREQTLNQLLVELDGFDARTGVILLGATNRPEILDPALLRAGRFDRNVLVDRPDKVGRLAILKLHAQKVPLADLRDLEELAALTAGFAGAELANIINEAALLAVRRGRETVGKDELLEAVERVVAGLERKNRTLGQKERDIVAHHEVGHALVALAMPGGDPVRKISIIPRGIAALGYTLQAPLEDRFLMTQSELENRIATLLGGRIAEELIFGEVSTGASDDLRKATDLARKMVSAYGMSAQLGKVSYEREDRAAFLGPQRSSDDHGEATRREIDLEVRRIVDVQFERARSILRGEEAILRQAAKALLEHEVLTGDALLALVEAAHRAPGSAIARA